MWCEYFEIWRRYQSLKNELFVEHRNMYYWPRKMEASKDCYEYSVDCNVSNRRANSERAISYLWKEKAMWTSAMSCVEVDCYMTQFCFEIFFIKNR